MALTRSQIRTQALALADIPANSLATDTVVDDFINAAVADTHGILATHYEDFATKTVDVATTADTDEYALPADFLKLRSLDLKGATIRDYVSLDPFVWAERDAWSDYPPASKTYLLRYVPTVTLLAADGTEFDLGGYEQIAVLEAAIRLRVKEEGEIAELYAMKRDAVARLVSEAAQRDAGRPVKAARVRTRGHGEWAPRYTESGADVRYCVMGKKLILRRPTRTI